MTEPQKPMNLRGLVEAIDLLAKAMKIPLGDAADIMQSVLAAMTKAEAVGDQATPLVDSPVDPKARRH
jgi:hypothetical protein